MQVGDRIDLWAFYQARNLRQEVAEATVTQIELSKLTAPAAAARAHDAASQRYLALAKEQALKKDELKALAEQDQKTYDALNYRDDQFDLSDALIAIAMLAVTALTRLWACAGRGRPRLVDGCRRTRRSRPAHSRGSKATLIKPVNRGSQLQGWPIWALAASWVANRREFEHSPGFWRTLCASPVWLSTPMCSFMPKNHCWPLRV